MFAVPGDFRFYPLLKPSHLNLATMKTIERSNRRGAVLLGVCFTVLSGAVAAEPHLTAITVFSLGPGATYDGVNGWDTVPTNGVPNIWVGTGVTPYNGPSDAEAGIDFIISPGSGDGGRPMAGAPGNLTEPYHGISLFFNGATVPQISAYQPTACSAGVPSPYGGSSLGLTGVVTAANSLRCVVEGLEIELGGYLWSHPACAEADRVSPFGFSPDGINDFVGGYLLIVTPLPQLSIARTETNTVVVSWPSPSTGYNLEVNSDLATTDWGTPLEGVTDNGAIKYIIVNPPPGNRFYRLMKP